MQATPGSGSADANEHEPAAPKSSLWSRDLVTRVKSMSQHNHAARHPAAEAESADKGRRRSSLTLGLLKPPAAPSANRTIRRASCKSAETTISHHTSVATMEQLTKMGEEMRLMQGKLDDMATSNNRKDEVLGKVLGDMETSTIRVVRTRTAATPDRDAYHAEALGTHPTHGDGTNPHS